MGLLMQQLKSLAPRQLLLTDIIWRNCIESCFDGFISALEKYKPYIANYFKQRKNSGFFEALNNKVKWPKDDAMALLRLKPFFSALFLDFQGMEIYA